MNHAKLLLCNKRHCRASIEKKKTSRQKLYRIISHAYRASSFVIYRPISSYLCFSEKQHRKRWYKRWYTGAIMIALLTDRDTYLRMPQIASICIAFVPIGKISKRVRPIFSARHASFSPFLLRNRRVYSTIVLRSRICNGGVQFRGTNRQQRERWGRRRRVLLADRGRSALVRAYSDVR